MSIDVKADLRATLGSARNQGPRPTCLAFAASDCHAAVRCVPFVPLSAEYAFYCAVLRKGGAAKFDKPVPLQPLLSAIELDGQPVESMWPYRVQLPQDIAEIKPPKGIGPVFLRKSTRIDASVDAICRALDQGRPTIVGFMPTLNFHYARAGGIVETSALDKPSGMAHAVLSAGWGLKGKERLVLVKNSWGVKWADAGYAWLSDPYLSKQLIVVVEMEP